MTKMSSKQMKLLSVILICVYFDRNIYEHDVIAVCASYATLVLKQQLLNVLKIYTEYCLLNIIDVKYCLFRDLLYHQSWYL